MKSWREILHDPRIDDSGDYDFYVEDLPQDYAKWLTSKYKDFRCDTCGKYSRIAFRQEHFFYCYDGWDSMDYTECLHCQIKNRTSAFKYEAKKLLKAFVKVAKCPNKIKVLKKAREIRVMGAELGYSKKELMLAKRLTMANDLVN